MGNPSRNAAIRTAVTSLLLALALAASALAQAWQAEVPSRPVAAVPVNPAATEEAKAVLNYLYSVSGKEIISGQHDYLESPDEWNEKVYRLTGGYPGIHGYELGAIMGQSKEKIAEQRQGVVDSAIAWHKQGGLVTITFHQSVPGTCACWAKVKTPMSQAKFERYVTPGTEEYRKLVADLDEAASYLKQLKDAGVPVLWRPYHEMNGDWFWWGKKDGFVKLWDLMYDRFVRVHELNNLLWVWSPNAPNVWSDPYENTYPGKDKVDVLAVDIYDNDFKQSYYDRIVKLADGKPVAIGESGELPGEDVLRRQPKWAYMVSWGEMLTGYNSGAAIRSFYGRSSTVKREGLPTARGPGPAFAASRDKAGSASGGGLRAEYFGDPGLKEPKEVRIDANVDFNWGLEAPADSVGADGFSVRWTGRIEPAYDEKYTFYTITDDGVRLWVDGELLIDSWRDQSWAERSGTIRLKAGVPVDIRMEYYDNRGGAMAKLQWSSPSLARETVPAGVLSVP